jgi:4-coumarate--CoA ligase (photoactive yellow protein activation family)
VAGRAVGAARELARADVLAVIADIAGAVLHLPPANTVAIDETSSLDPGGLGVDSLALLELATAVATFFRLDESGLEDELIRRRRVGDWVDTVMRSWAHGSRRITFSTSGSTGEPEPCTHVWADLAQEMDAHAEMFASRRRVVGLVGPRHIYGFLFCALLPRWLGIAFVDARGTAPTGLASLARAGDLVVGFPLRWRLAAAAAGRWNPAVVGVTSTGPIDPATVAALRGRGLERMVEVYGSSQTAGIAWRDDPAEPLRPYPHWSLRRDGMLERADAQTPGRTRVIEPPDHLVARSGGFDVTGRRDRMVQVAGANVSCAHVAAVLAEHPAVSLCTVRAMRAEEGSRLKAFIVLNDSLTQDAARSAIAAWARTRLSAAETPMNLAFGAALPRDAHGKLADWPLHRSCIDVA